jgi:transposase
MVGSVIASCSAICLRHIASFMSEDLVGGEGFAIDASAVKADVNRARG